MKIVQPEDFSEEEQQECAKELEITYEATDMDEEKFMLMYHMNLQPSEIDAMADDYRQWLVARFLTQKHMEKEMYEQARVRQAIMPGLNNLRND